MSNKTSKLFFSKEKFDQKKQRGSSIIRNTEEFLFLFYFPLQEAENLLNFE